MARVRNREDRAYKASFVWRVVVLLFAVYAAVSVASLVGVVWAPLEITTHFRPQLAAAAVVFALLFAVGRRFLAILPAAGLLIFHVIPLVPYVLPSARAAGCAGGHDLRVLTLNLHHRHADIDAVVRMVRSERPDVVLLTEFQPSDLAAIAALRDILPHSTGPTGQGAFHLLLMSRFRIDKKRIAFPTPKARFLPVIEIRLCPDGAPCFTVVGLHAARPLGAESHLQDAHLDLAAERAARTWGGRVVLMGDLNTTPWSPGFRELLDAGRLRDAGDASAFHGTWMSRNPLFGLAIDHVLVGRRVRGRDRRVGPNVGSDHFPVIADLTICG